MFGLIIPAWFATPFGFKDTNNIWTEMTHKAYDLTPHIKPNTTKHFWHYTYDIT